jgi:large subunit ribosomal protein L9
MKIVLQKDVKNVGKVGDVVNVKDGFARNFLFPRRLAVEATETRVKAWQHQLKVSEAKKKKVIAERKELLTKLAGLTLTFKMVAGEKEKIFGAVTAHDISKDLELKGYSVDRRDIEMEPIKELGQHKAIVTLGEGLTAEVTVSVERATA